MASSAQIQQWIVAAAAQDGVDPSLALAVARQESGFNQAAISSAGAIGVMQLMPATAAQLGVDPHDPQQNILGGVRYLAMLLSEFGDPVAAVAAYDWGPGAVASAIAAYGPTWLAQAPAETQSYVQRILGVSASSYVATATGPAPAPAPVAIDASAATDSTGSATDFTLAPLPAAAPSTSLDQALPWIALLAGGAVVWAAAQ